MAAFPVPDDASKAFAQFAFIDESLYLAEKSYFCGENLPAEMQQLRTNHVLNDHRTEVVDLRGHEHLLSLETHSVQFVRQPEYFMNLEEISSTDLLKYIEETCDLIKSILDTEKCICYSYRVG